MRVPSQPETSMDWPIRSLASAGVRCGRCGQIDVPSAPRTGWRSGSYPSDPIVGTTSRGEGPKHLAWTRQRQTGHRRLGPHDSRQQRRFPAAAPQTTPIHAGSYRPRSRKVKTRIVRNGRGLLFSGNQASFARAYARRSMSSSYQGLTAAAEGRGTRAKLGLLWLYALAGARVAQRDEPGRGGRLGTGCHAGQETVRVLGRLPRPAVIARLRSAGGR
jgi:hypothetical protein